MASDIHNYKARVVGMMRRANNSPLLSQEIKDSIARFRDDCFAHSLTAGRVARYLHDVIVLHEWAGKDLGNAPLADIRHIVARIEQTDYAPVSKRDFKIALRKYVHFVQGTEAIPSTVSWIRASAGVRTLRIPEEVLTPEEVTRMVQSAENARDRALIAVLYESGCRIGEVLGVRGKDVTAASPGVVMRVDGKTGPRRVRLVSSTPYLTEILNGRSGQDASERQIWVTRGGTPMQYAGTVKMLRVTARKAGVTKHIYPHLFRHSRATHLASYLTEAQMKAYFGWAQASKMAGVYVHMSGRDVDSAILRLNGVEVEKKSTLEVLPPKSCSRCGTSNGPTNRFCSACAGPMSSDAALELSAAAASRSQADAILDGIIDDPEVMELLRRKIVERAVRTTGVGGKNVST